LRQQLLNVITETLRGTKTSPGTICNFNKETYEHIEACHNQLLAGGKYLYVNSISFKCSWCSEYENVANIANGVNKEGHQEIFEASEGLKGDKDS